MRAPPQKELDDSFDCLPVDRIHSAERPRTIYNHAAVSRGVAAFPALSKLQKEPRDYAIWDWRVIAGHRDRRGRRHLRFRTVKCGNQRLHRDGSLQATKCT